MSGEIRIGDPIENLGGARLVAGDPNSFMITTDPSLNKYAPQLGQLVIHYGQDTKSVTTVASSIDVFPLFSDGTCKCITAVLGGYSVIEITNLVTELDEAWKDQKLDYHLLLVSENKVVCSDNSFDYLHFVPGSKFFISTQRDISMESMQIMLPDHSLIMFTAGRLALEMARRHKLGNVSEDDFRRNFGLLAVTLKNNE